MQYGERKRPELRQTCYLSRLRSLTLPVLHCLSVKIDQNPLASGKLKLRLWLLRVSDSP
jgi:hypothetical protein